MWDLFGKALRDFQRDGACPPYCWRRDDDTCQEESIANYFAPLAEWKRAELNALPHVVGRVLDVGCGAGKHALEFQRRGLPVVGIDVSALALSVCRARGVREVHEMDAYDMRFDEGSFDCATMFTNNLSMGGTPEGIRRLLSEVRRVVKPSGRLVMTNLDVSATPVEQDLAYQEGNRRAGLPAGQIRMRPEYDGEVGGWINWMFVSPGELAELARACGWRVSGIIESGGPYTAVLDRSS
jgi:SAM-dependent methyltransferase